MLFGMCVLGCQLQAQVSFMSSSTNVVGNNPFSVVAADVNGDGKVDLISANNGRQHALGADEQWQWWVCAVWHICCGQNPRIGVTAADVNGDGKVDLICANAR